MTRNREEGRKEPGRRRRALASPAPRALTRIAPAYLWLVVGIAPFWGCGDGDVIQEPTPLYGEVPIEYPLDLWDADVEGITLLRVRVTEMGVVDSVEVLEGSGYPTFDSAAVRGALDLRYNPARKNGERTTVWAKVPVHFTKEAP